MYKENFKIYLERLGYSKSSQSMLPTCVAEFLSCLEEKGICHLQEIEPKHIADHYEYLSQRPNKRKPGGLSSRMITHHIYAIRLFLNYQEQIGNIAENPISGLYFPHPESQQREILSIEEIKQLYEATETHRERAILGMFYGCGLRRNEGVELNVRDISFNSSLLYVRDGKGSKRRVIPINEKVKNDFKNYLYNERFSTENACTERSRSETAFITNARGKRTSGNSYNEALKKILVRVGFPPTGEREGGFSLHNLRHSIATHLLENGLSVEYVRDFLGHKHLEATQIYTRISTKKLSTL
jgi:integrase/recombinase XerD